MKTTNIFCNGEKKNPKTFNVTLQPTRSYRGSVLGTGSVFSTGSPERLGEVGRYRPLSWLGVSVSAVLADGPAGGVMNQQLP